MYSTSAVREQFHCKNRTDIKKKALPFFYPADNKDNLAILVHGFSGSPFELQELGKFLSEHNINAQGVLLAGHGGSYDIFAQADYRDWWNSVKTEIDTLKEEYKNIYLIGYSFGSNIVMDIASRYPSIFKGVVCLGPSMYLRKHRAIKSLFYFYRLYNKKKVNKARMPKTRRAIFESRGTHITLPMSSLKSFFYFIDDFTKKQLDQFISPILLIHSRDDAVSSPKSSEMIFERINSEDKELFILNEFEHNPLNSRNRDVIFDKILTFIEEHQ